MSHVIALDGCTPTPLAHYLKALGVLRLVAEQADANALGWWEGDRFHLESRLDRNGLLDFFAHDYAPTPVIAPWNGGSGFYPNDNMSGIGPLAVATAPRFTAYARAIREGQALISVLRLYESPKDEAKAEFLVRLRARLADDALRWLDAAVVLGDGSLRYPPLLGTGGNDGRLDFTNNLMQRLMESFDPRTGDPSRTATIQLPVALFAAPGAVLCDRAIGQFQPGAAGGPNASTGFSGTAQVNPWDFLLMIEGALPFAATVTRRFESGDSAALAFPFSVRPRLAGIAAVSESDEGSARGELWLPLWRRQVGFAELQVLFGEGRITIGRRPVRDGLDFARAIVAFGADRGLDAFERYVFTMRSGKAFLATPVGRVDVTRNPNADLIADLDRSAFLDRLRGFARSDLAPGSVRSAARRLDDALFAMTTTPAAREPVQRALMALGGLQAIIGASSKAREKVIPVPVLSAAWVLAADDGTHEFRLAVALAGTGGSQHPMRAHLAPLSKDGRAWMPDSHECVGADGRLDTLLAAVLHRRLLPRKQESTDRDEYAWPMADSVAVAAFLARRTDDARLHALLAGLALARLPVHLPTRSELHDPLPAAFVALALVFSPAARLFRLGLLNEGVHWPAPRPIAAKLVAGDVPGAVELAWRRLRAAGFPLPTHPRHPPALIGLDGRRLLAALVVPLRDRDFHRYAKRLQRVDNSPEAV